MHILLAGDDTFFQKFYQSQLQEHGHTVDVAVDGKDALKQLAGKKPDLLILDIIMPHKDGFEVLVELQKMPSLAHLPILIFSTLGQEQDVERALKLGASGYVNKSFFDFDTLLAKIDEVVKSSHRP